MKKLISLTLFLLAFSSIAIGQISDSEKNALIDIYTSTNGNEWNTSWDLDKEVSNWHGVTISNNTVTGINLIMNNLNGSIPKSCR